MSCDDFRPQLTAYLDGELDGDRGSAVRGHLRGCEACRAAARDEAALRDGLRMLPPIDPPASLWAGVRDQLAAAEVADAERPAWRRAVARWWAIAIGSPRWGLVGVALAALVAVLVWKSHREPAQAPVAVAPAPPAPVAVAPPPPPHVEPAPIPAAEPGDVTAALEAQPARHTADYAEAARQLAELADAARQTWPDDRRREFDARVAELRGKIDAAAEGRPRQQAYRALIRYLERAAVRDEVAAL